MRAKVSIAQKRLIGYMTNRASPTVVFFKFDIMNAKWVGFIIALISGFAFFTLGDDLRQAIARYIFFCLITAIVIRPLGIALGRFLRRLFKRD